MTRYYVNQSEIPSPPTGVRSLHELLEHVEHAHLPPNNVIRQVQIDGRLLVSNERGEIPPEMMAGIDLRERIEITTGTLQEIARESLDEALSYLDRVERVIPSLASSFQASPGPEAFENLKELYTGFYWLNMLVDRLAKNLKVSFSDVLLRGSPLREHNEKFVSILRQLVESQEKADFVLVADLLEYEVLPLIPVWKELFVDLGHKMDAAPTA